MGNFKDLIVWQKSMELVKCVYDFTNTLPKSESYNLTEQMRRAVVSVSSNIAEGCERKTTKDYLRFLNIAAGSVAELFTQLEICKTVNYITEENKQLFEPANLLQTR